MYTRNKLTVCLKLVIVLAMFGFVASTVEELQTLMENIESHVLKFAKEVESRYASRCSLTLQDCNHNNYDNCNTEYPYQSCPA